MKKIVSLVALFVMAPPSRAQSLLPEGIGLYQWGMRSFDRQSERYDASGTRVPLGAKFDKQFQGANLLTGSGGADLKRLAEELKKYDSQGDDASLVESLDLGEIHGDVQADVRAQFVGLGFGLTPKLTLFMGMPWVEATVRTSIVHSGANNAAAVKSQLGDLAFAELAEGLDRASRISGAQVAERIEAAGYAPLDKWSHSGPGDLKMGAKTSFAPRLAKGFAAGIDMTGTLTVPTGYVEDPDVLTDVSFGRGYYTLALSSSQKLIVARHGLVGFDLSYGKSLAATMKKRLPEGDEDLVAPERVTDVTIRPGDDQESAVFVGFRHDWVDTRYRFGASRHFGDRYSGGLGGNYERLAEDSSSYQAFHEVAIALSSVNAYKGKAMPIPAILELKMHRPVEARNSNDERYYEASIASFFATPHARP